MALPSFKVNQLFQPFFRLVVLDWIKHWLKSNKIVCDLLTFRLVTVDVAATVAFLSRNRKSSVASWCLWTTEQLSHMEQLFIASYLIE